MLDLQVHTRASDGRLRLDEVVAIALRQELLCIAITDHDTIDGWASPQEREKLHVYGSKGLLFEPDEITVKGLGIIHATETTCNYRGHEIHLLGYFLDAERVNESPLGEHNKQMLLAQQQRAKHIVDALQKSGYNISWELFTNEKMPAMLPRDYIAAELLKRNSDRLRHELTSLTGDRELPLTPRLVRNALLVKDGPYYDAVERNYAQNTGRALPEMEEVIGWMLTIGAVPVVSHPARYKFLATPAPLGPETKFIRMLDHITPINPETFVHDLKRASNNLAGLEVYNAKHKPDQLTYWLGLARKHGIFYTAGTDFHGEPGDRMGMIMSDDVLTNLRAMRKRIRAS